jgi:dihydrofolate reductase
LLQAKVRTHLGQRGTVVGSSSFLAAWSRFGHRWFWPPPSHVHDGKVLTSTAKYVASRMLRAPLPWPNSTLLGGDAADSVTRLKEQPGKDLVVLGSGELVQTLARNNLVDEYVRLIHPLLLGSGRRPFDHTGARASLQFVDAKTSPSGVLIMTYRPTEQCAA